MEILIGLFAAAIFLVIIGALTKYQKRSFYENESEQPAPAKRSTKQNDDGSTKKLSKKLRAVPKKERELNGNLNLKASVHADGYVEPNEHKKSGSTEAQQQQNGHPLTSEVEHDALKKPEVAGDVQAHSEQDVRRRNNKKSKRSNGYAMPDNVFDEKVEEQLASLSSSPELEAPPPSPVMPISEAEKKIKAAEEREAMWIPRYRDLEAKFADQEKKHRKVAEEAGHELAKMKSSLDAKTAALRDAEKSAAELKRRIEAISQDKMILQNEVSENVRRRATIEKEFGASKLEAERLRGSQADRERQFRQLSNELQEARRQLSEREAEITRIQSSLVMTSGPAYESLIREVRTVLPDFVPGAAMGPGSLSECVRAYASKHAEQARKRSESEAERCQVVLKQRVGELENEIARLRREIEHSKGDIGRSKQESEDGKRHSAERIRALEEEAARWRVEIERLHAESESRVMEEHRRLDGEFSERLAKLEADSRREQEKLLADKDRALGELTSNRDELRLRVSKLEGMLRDATASSENHGASQDEMSKQMGRLHSEVAELSAALEQTRSAMSDERVKAQNSRDEAASRVQNLETQLAQVSENRDKLTEYVAKLENDLKQLTVECESAKNGLVQEQNVTGDVRRQLSQMERDLGEARNAINSLETSSGQKDGDISSLAKQLDDVRSMLSQERINFSDREAALCNEKQHIHEETQRLLAQVDNYNSTISGLNSEVATLKEQLSNKDDSGHLQNEIQRLVAELEDARRSSARIGELEQILNDSKLEHQRTMQELEDEVVRVRNENNNSKELLHNAEGTLGQLQQDLASFAESHPALEAENAKLREDLEQAQHALSSSEASLQTVGQELTNLNAQWSRRVAELEASERQLQEFVRAGEEAVRSEQARNDDLQRKIDCHVQSALPIVNGNGNHAMNGTNGS